MDIKIKTITFSDARHRIAGVHCGQTLVVGEKVSARLNGPFVECVFAKDILNMYLVPISGISSIQIESVKDDNKHDKADGASGTSQKEAEAEKKRRVA
jgi:hypothetical protein